MTEKKLKIGIIMSGAVSLGSFEAGVITELFWAIDQKNKEIRDGKEVILKDNVIEFKVNKFEVDVITGASAGSLTAALAASIVMNDYTKINNLRKAWVDDADIAKLLEDSNQKDCEPKGFLNRKSIEEIADSNIVKNYEECNVASFAPDNLYIGFTLTNLNGFDRVLKLHNDRTYYTYFDDSKLFKISKKNEVKNIHTDDSDSSSCWDDVKDFAIASGCFPFAFSPKSLSKSQAEYDIITDKEKTGKIDSDYISHPSLFIDGGTFNNQPVGLAIALANKIDKKDKQEYKRIFFFINAHPNSHKNSLFIPDAVLKNKNLKTLDGTLVRLLNMIHAQSRASDYLNSSVINDRIIQKSKFYTQITEIVNFIDLSSEHTQALNDRLNKIAMDIFNGALATAPIRTFEKASKFNEILENIKEDYKKCFDVLHYNAHRENILALIFYIFDNISDLEDRTEADIFSLSKDEEKLAGEQIGWFGGFFDKQFRNYNFMKGREVTREKLKSLEDYFNDYKKEPLDEEDAIILGKGTELCSIQIDSGNYVKTLDLFYGRIADEILKCTNKLPSFSRLYIHFGLTLCVFWTTTLSKRNNLIYLLNKWLNPKN